MVVKHSFTKSNDVYHVRASALLDLCPLEDEDPRNETASPGISVSEALNPWTRRLPYQPTDDERADTLNHSPTIQSVVYKLCERVSTRLATP